MQEQPSPTPIDASSRAAEYARMLDEAKRQPGVADIAAVYENWRQADVITQAVTAASTPSPIAQASNSSAPSY